MTKPTTWVAGAAVLALTVPGMAQLAATAAPSPAPATQPAGRFTPTATTKAKAPVTLPTGDVIAITTGSDRRITELSRTTRGPLQSVTLGKATYLYPAVLQHQVGGVLDVALFDVAKLSAASGRIPVTIRYASASAPTAVAGVEIAKRSGLSATGYITPGSSRALGVALRTQSGDALFAHVASVRSMSPGGAIPLWPMHTVTIHVIGADGKPLEGMIGYLDTMDPTKFGGFGFAVRGKAKISVPTGTIQVVSMSSNSTYTKSYLAITPELTVSGPREVTVDARTATTQVKTVLDRPVDAGAFGATDFSRIIESSQGAAGYSWTFIGDAENPVYVTPTSGTVHGRQSLSQSVAASGGTGGSAFRYATYGGAEGRIPAKNIITRPGPRNSMMYKTTLVGNFDPSSAIFSRGVMPVSGGWTLGSNPPAKSFTEIVSTGPGLIHQSALTQQISFDPVFSEKGDFTGPTIMAPAAGTTRNETWGQAPLHQLFAPLAPAGVSQDCPACIGNGPGIKALTIRALPLSDRVHIGGGDFTEPDIFTSHVLVKADNAVVFDGDANLSGILEFPAGTKTLSTTQVASRSGSLHTNATKMTTSMSAKVSSAFPAPPGLGCATQDTCRFLPFLSLDYSAPATDANVLPAGARTVGLTVKQAGRAVAQGVTSVKAWVSYDGRTWTAVPVTGSGATYAARLTVPRAGAGRSLVGLKVAVLDRAGSTLTEQIDGAYRLAR